MKTLGLIGGTSWHSTIEYYRYINQLVAERKGHHVNPPLLLYSLNVELMRRGDWQEIEASYLAIAQNLAKAGADAILICANTPHKVCSYVAPQLSIPILHIADAIGQAAQRQELTTLGLLGTQPVTEGDYISGPLAERYGVRTLVPDAENRKQIQAYIADELTQGRFLTETKQYFIEEMAKLRDRGADGIILGCTELPILLQSEDFELPLLNTTYLHALQGVAFLLD